jgi:hypothetical protein
MLARMFAATLAVVSLQAQSTTPEHMTIPTAVPVFSDGAAGFVVTTINQSDHDVLIPPSMLCHVRIDGVREPDRGATGGASRVKSGQARVEMITIVSDEKLGRPWGSANPLPGVLGAQHNVVFQLAPGPHKAAFQCAGTSWSDDLNFYWVTSAAPRSGGR